MQTTWKPGFQKVNTKLAFLFKKIGLLLAILLVFSSFQAKANQYFAPTIQTEVPVLRASASLDLAVSFQAGLLSVDMSEAFQGKYPAAVLTASLAADGNTILVTLFNAPQGIDASVGMIVIENAGGSGPLVAQVSLRDNGIEIAISDI